MVCGFAWAGWVALAIAGAGILLSVVQRWRHGARECAAYRIGYKDGAEGLQPLPGRRRWWRRKSGPACGACGR